MPSARLNTPPDHCALESFGAEGFGQAHRPLAATPVAQVDSLAAHQQFSGTATWCFATTRYRGVAAQPVLCFRDTIRHLGQAWRRAKTDRVRAPRPHCNLGLGLIEIALATRKIAAVRLPALPLQERPSVRVTSPPHFKNDPARRAILRQKRTFVFPPKRHTAVASGSRSYRRRQRAAGLLFGTDQCFAGGQHGFLWPLRSNSAMRQSHRQAAMPTRLTDAGGNWWSFLKPVERVLVPR